MIPDGAERMETLMMHGFVKKIKRFSWKAGTKKNLLLYSYKNTEKVFFFIKKFIKKY
jgi:hypothetical protein